MSKQLSRAALLALAPLFVSCAVGVSGEDLTQTMGMATADGGVGGLGIDGGLTAGLADTGGLTGGGIGGPVFPAPVPGGPTGGTGGTAGGTGGGQVAPPTGARNPQRLPMAAGACPQFATGEAQFAPAGEQPRRVYLWSGAASGGPLIIYWHSTSGMPAEAGVALSGVIEMVTAAGGVVAAPYPGATEGMYPWVDTVPVSLKVADAIVACAVSTGRVSPARIHTLGYSAGGLMAGSLAVQRSSYIASMAAYSGGQTGTARGMFEDPSNKVSGLLFHGGTSDMAGGTNFPTAAAQYAMTLKGNGGAAVVCNHNMGRAMPLDGPAAVLRFFEDHPFGRPSPYAAGLPQGFPAYCQLQP